MTEEYRISVEESQKSAHEETMWGKPARGIITGISNNTNVRPVRAIWELVQNACDVVKEGGRVNLNSDSSLCCAPEGLDLKMLFYPLKKEFYAPTIFVKNSNLCSWYLHIVGQVDKCLVLVCRIVCDTTKNGWVSLIGMIASKPYNLVRKHTIRIMHGITFANDFVLKISSLSYYKIGINLSYAGKSYIGKQRANLISRCLSQRRGLL